MPTNRKRKKPSPSANRPRRSKGSAALAEKFEAEYGAAAECSKRLRISPVRLSRIAAGKSLPLADEGARLVHLGIPIHWWDEPPPPDEQEKNPQEPAA
jgi:hypothetical protein